MPLAQGLWEESESIEDYSASAVLITVALVPLGPGRWRAQRSSSVIGTGMQKPPVPQVTHGELTELSVTGGHEVEAVAVENEPPTLVVPSKSSTVARHGAGATVGAGAGSIASLSDTVASAAVRPGPLGAPVSSTSGPEPPPTRVNVNFGHTFRLESNVLELIVIDPVEAL